MYLLKNQRKIRIKRGKFRKNSHQIQKNKKESQIQLLKSNKKSCKKP